MMDDFFSLKFFLIAVFLISVILMIGIVIGIHISKTSRSHRPIEEYVMILSAFFVAGSIVFQTLGFLESFSSIVITMFSSIVFSWLLTKLSGKEEWQEREQELALRSYRHIDYVESASKTAEKTINQYINDEGSSVSLEQKLVLSRALDYIGYIRGGIRTCKMDWYDLMSKEGQARFTTNEPVDQTVNTDDISMSQEDA